MREEPGFVAALDQLRAGTLSFTKFARQHHDHFMSWAQAIVRRRRCEHVQSWLGLDDLVQHGLLACWRAVDSFDPTAKRANGQAATLHGYVAYQVGHAMDREVERAAGWPRKDRKRQPARQVDAEVVAPSGRSRGWSIVTGRPTDGSAIERCAEMTGQTVPSEASTRIYTGVVAKRFGNGLALDVVVGAVQGWSPHEMAAAIYADPERRYLYRLDSERHARARVREAAGTVGKVFVRG